MIPMIAEYDLVGSTPVVRSTPERNDSAVIHAEGI
jgi:hypothetical protein